MAGSKRQPDEATPRVRKERAAEATGTENASQLVAGCVYTGEITAREDDGTYTVSVGDPKQDVYKVQLALPVFGGLMGLQVRSTLPEKTGVKIAYGPTSFIFAVIPENSTDWLNAQNRSLLFGPDMYGRSEFTEDNFSDGADDLLQGEVELGNLYGCALDFLTAIIRMRASDRATVECHLINDMVRVISSQYRHISGIGEDLIFDHGRPTMERTWSSYRHELMGQLEEKVPYAEMNGHEVDRDKLEEKRVTGLGRHRFIEFAGFAGDFIHSFVCDPPAAMVSLAKGQAGAGSSDNLQAGKSWFHRNSDGAVIIQSTAEIRLERVCRIPVGVRCEPHESPEITKAREYDKLDKDFLKLPKALTPADPMDSYQMAYHIRSYSRWLGRYHSFARMLQLSDEYAIPSEDESPAPDWNNAEADRKDQNPLASHYDTYACISIMRDGSIVTQDGYGSSIVMSNGNLQISAARHLDLEAAGDIRMIAGGSILAKARRNIEFSATLGGMILHGYSWMKMLCERGTVWLRSNAVTDQGTTPESKEDGPTPEIAGWESGASDGFAVLIESTAGSTVLRSEKGITIAVDGSPTGEDDNDFDVTITTPGGASVHGQKSADVHSEAQVRVSAGIDLVLATPTLLSTASTMLIGPSVTSPTLSLRGETLWADSIEAQNISGNAIKGPEVGPRSTGADQVAPHLNHINELKQPLVPLDGASPSQEEAATEAVKLSHTGPEIPWDGSSDGPEWSFSEKSEYVWDSREKVVGGIPETLTQQYLRLDAALTDPDKWKGPGYEDWNFDSYMLVGDRTSDKGGFGFYEPQFQASSDGEDLRVPSPTAAKDTPTVTPKWDPRLFSIKALKRPV